MKVGLTKIHIYKIINLALINTRPDIPFSNIDHGSNCNATLRKYIWDGSSVGGWCFILIAEFQIFCDHNVYNV